MKVSSEELFFNYYDYIQKLCHLIDESKRFIYLQCYIFEPDEFGLLVIDALNRASNRGVTIRIQLDGFGSHFYTFRQSHPVSDRLDPKISLRIYRPILSNMSDKWPWTKRNHRKWIIIDGTNMFIGGMNIHKRNWKDVSVLLSLKMTSTKRSIDELFLNLWNEVPIRSRAWKHFFQDSPIMINDTFWLRRLMNGRKKKFLNENGIIRIITPYLNPNHELLGLLRTAKKRSAKVTILLPIKSDVLFMRFFHASICPIMIAMDIQILFYTSGFLHSKLWLGEQSAWLGSSNLNRRSLDLDLEMDYFTQEPRTLKRLDLYFTELTRSSISYEQAHPFLFRLVSNLSYLILKMFQKWL